jgi:hypothetical protein
MDKNLGPVIKFGTFCRISWLFDSHYHQLWNQNQLRDVFELMREQNLNEEEQRAVGGIWLNRLLQPLVDVRYRGNHSVFGIIDF